MSEIKKIDTATFDAHCARLREGTLTDTSFMFWSKDLDYEQVRILADIVSINTILKRLTLENNTRIKDAGMIALANMLRSNTALKRLVLNNTGCGTQGAIALADVLCANNTLTKLTLNFNAIGDAGAAKLASMLRINNSLEELSGNRNIGDVGVTAVAGMLHKNRTLIQLSLTQASCGDAGVVAIADALCINMTLRFLWIVFINVGPAGVRALANSLRINTAVTALHYNNNIDAAADKEIAGYLKRNVELPWLPKHHHLFPDQCQRVLCAVMLGLRRLKSRQAGQGTHDELLVHVDPACIEQALETIRRNDKWLL